MDDPNLLSDSQRGLSSILGPMQILNTKVNKQQWYTKIFICDSWFSSRIKKILKTIILKVIFQLEENMKTSSDVFQKVLRITTDILLNTNTFFTFFQSEMGIKQKSVFSLLSCERRKNLEGLIPLLNSPAVCCCEPEKTHGSGILVHAPTVGHVHRNAILQTRQMYKSTHIALEFGRLQRVQHLGIIINAEGSNHFPFVFLIVFLVHHLQRHHMCHVPLLRKHHWGPPPRSPGHTHITGILAVRFGCQ